MALVVIESPFAGRGWWLFNFIRRWINVLYARRCMADAFARFEVPFASHLLYTQRGVLDDNKPRERGIDGGFEWAYHGDARVFYLDRGFSYGMRLAERHAYMVGQKIIYRSLTLGYSHTLGGEFHTYPGTAGEALAWRAWEARIEQGARERLIDAPLPCRRARCTACGGVTLRDPRYYAPSPASEGYELTENGDLKRKTQ